MITAYPERDEPTRSDRNRHRNDKRCRPSVGNVSVQAVLLISQGISMFFLHLKLPLISLDHAKRERKDASASFRPSLVRSFRHPRVIRSCSAPT